MDFDIENTHTPCMPYKLECVSTFGDVLMAALIFCRGGTGEFDAERVCAEY
jgi:hypothetical protein